MDNNTSTDIELEKKSEKIISQATEGGKSDTLAIGVSNDLTTQVTYLKWLTIGVSVVIAIGFILNLFDIFNYRFKYFDEYQKKIGDLEKQDINLENQIKLLKANNPYLK